jgi:hypothetical protein
MNPEIFAVFIPIIATLVIGVILVTYFFLRSREKQLLIEKGLDAQTIKEFFKSKKDPFRLLKIGIVTIAFGLGTGLGIMLERNYYGDYWVVLCLFTITGAGFVVANLVSRKLEKGEDK